MKGSSKDHMDFTLRMCKKLEDELDTLIWYGLSKNELKAPASGKVGECPFNYKFLDVIWIQMFFILLMLGFELIVETTGNYGKFCGL